MKTQEVLSNLPVTSNLHPSIPIPFFEEGEPRICVLLYPLAEENGQKRTLAPVEKLTFDIKDGKLLRREQAPFADSKAKLHEGRYPNKFLSNLHVTAANAKYEQYYEACDKFLAGEYPHELLHHYHDVREEGLEEFFDELMPLKSSPSFTELISKAKSTLSNQRLEIFLKEQESPYFSITFTGKHDLNKSKFVDLLNLPNTENDIRVSCSIIDKNDKHNNKLGYADCVVFCMDARMFASIDETSFLRDELKKMNIPFVAICVMYFDETDEEDRPELLKYILKRAAEIAPGAKLWFTSDIGEPRPEKVDAVGVSEIRAALQQMAHSEILKELREKRTLARVRSFIDDELAQLKLEEAAQLLDEQKRKKAIQELEIKRNSIEMEFSEIELFAVKAKNATVRDIINDLHKQRETILDDALHQLNHTNNPKEWIEVDFPYLLTKFIRNLVDYCEKTVHSRIVSAHNNICKKLSEKFSMSSFPIPESAFAVPEYEPAATGEEDVKDMDKLRRRARIIQTAAVATLAITLFPFSPALLLGAPIALGAEIWLRKSLKEQQKALKEVTIRKVEEVMLAIEEKCVAYIEDLYTELLTLLRQRAEVIQNSLHSTLTAPKHDLSQRRKQLEELQQLFAE